MEEGIAETPDNEEVFDFPPGVVGGAADADTTATANTPRRNPAQKRVAAEPTPPDETKSVLDKLLDHGFQLKGMMDEPGLKTILSELHRKWIFSRELSTFRVRAYESFGLDPNAATSTLSSERVSQAYHKVLFQAFRVYMLFVANNLVSSETDDTAETRKTFSAIFETIVFTYEYLSSEYRMRVVTENANNAALEALVPLDIQLFRFSFPDYSQNTEYQNFLIFLLNKLYTLGYRRYRGKCYHQIRSPDGYATHAWREACDIEEFVYSAVNKQINYKMWQCMTKGKGIPEQAANYLARIIDPEFPALNPDRHVFAFRDGLYNSEAMVVSFFDEAAINPNVTAVNYFDCSVPRNIWGMDDWYAIPTESIQSVYTQQDLPEDVIRWMYALKGRLLYEVGELDSWQVILFVIGKAGTGKSTIGKCVAAFYQPMDVAVLSSNIEKKFGLSNVYDKKLFVAYEVRANFGLEQAEFQSMCSGEPMSIARKFNSTVDIRWKVPGLLCGNEAPGWVDAARSVQRRTICVEFQKRVKKPDPQLHDKMMKEIVQILHKSNVAYQEMVFRFRDQDVWDVLPDYFHQTAKRFAASTNSLTSFIMISGKVELGTDHATYYMPFGDFTKEYSNYVKAKNLTMIRMNEESYNSIFESFGITIEKGVYKAYNNRNTRGDFLMGIRMIPDTDVSLDNVPGFHAAFA